MMNRNKYLFKKELKNKILDGDSIKIASKKAGISQGYLTNILNGKIHCSKIVVSRILYGCNINENIESYFEVIENE